MFSAKSITSLPLSSSRRRQIVSGFMIMFSAKYMTPFPECDPSATRVRPECDPSEAFNVIKYRDNSCEMKKISFIQTTKYNEYT
jgi:hypothetical protein